MRYLITVTLLLIAGAAFGQQDFPRDIEVCWTNADQYVDGSVIEAGDLENVRIEIYRQNDTVPTFTATVPATGEGVDQCATFTGAVPNPGTYQIEGYSIVVGGIESDPSTPLYKKYVGKPRSVILRSIN